MFEGAIAAVLNRFLGRYVEDLDTEKFNVGIFSGDTCLTDLKLRPEALYHLGLPIKVEVGLVGKIILKIPWSGLFAQPIVLCLEDIYIVAVSAMYGPYDPEIQKKLIRAEKRKILEDLEEDGSLKAGLPSDFFDDLITSVIRNFHIAINNVHIRYEEKFPSNLWAACGVCIQSISVTTTNNKWKPGVCPNNSQTIYQLVRTESLSVYLDESTESCLTEVPPNWDALNFRAWKSMMQKSLRTFGMNDREFRFVLKPFTAKIKVIIHKGNETQSSRVLIDIVLQDIAMQISEAQYNTFCRLYDSLTRAAVNRPYRKHRPDKSVEEDPLRWWRYAYDSVVEHDVLPYTWPNVLEHRKRYRLYRDAYARTLVKPNDTELKLDLQKYEDTLTILNIVIAREQARQELRSDEYVEESGNSRRKLAEREANGRVTTASSEGHDKLQDVVKWYGDKDCRKCMYHRLMDNGPGAKIKLEKLPRPIDYKYNFTLANCSLNFLSGGREVVVLTLTQLLTSIEAQPAALAFKVSARAESFVVEGISSEGDLVPLVVVDNVLTGNVSSNFLAIDFEKRGVHVDPSFDVSIKLDSIEIIYHHHATMEIMKFLKFNDIHVEDTVCWAYRLYSVVKEKFLGFVDDVLSQALRINFKMDVKGPYIVFPENGAIQRGGHLLIVDFGSINVSNELQASNLQLEDATLMEMEELLYDRFHIACNGGQILFCHSGEDWRATRRRKDSEYHFLPKVQANVTLSYSIKPEYRQLPRMKINVCASTIKFDITEEKLRLIIHFLEILSQLCYIDAKKCYKLYLNDVLKKKSQDDSLTSIEELKRVRSNICLSSLTIAQAKFTRATEQLLTDSVPKLDRNVVSSEVSEEDLELLSKTANLCGFDDNVSPCNRVDLLLRFAIGELSLHLGCVVDGREEPYLNLRLHTIYLESAVMEYGPAIQFGVGSVLLVDKTNVGVTGSYLELLSTGDSHEALVVSYRKVKSNCPDFKSHFKNIERSLMMNLLNVNVVFHRTAILKLRDYWNVLSDICRGSDFRKLVERVYDEAVQWIERGDDPPIPPGAIKLNYSARLGVLVLRFCDKDSDLLEMKISGVENDCIYNANERMVFRAHVRDLLVEDLNEDTLFAKILATDEEKLLDFKYVRHTPKLYVCCDIDTNQDDVMSDGTFKLSFGRLNCVFISKILRDFQHFAMPFSSMLCTRLTRYLKDRCIQSLEEFKRSATKLHVFIDIQGPVFLLPQKKDMPSLLVFETGALNVENFFKRAESTMQSSSKMPLNDASQVIIDNILIKLKSVTLSRAIMMLRGDLEVQEPIVEPIQVHLDVKRKTEYRGIMEYRICGIFDVQGSIDHVFVNLSQGDVKSMILVWKDNISKLARRCKAYESERIACECDLRRVKSDDGMVEKLEVFLAQHEANVCEVDVKFVLEGLQLNLFFDAEEVLSSPVRDLNHGLCKLSFGEIINTYDLYSDKSFKMKFSVQSCMLQDTRKGSILVRKVIQSPAKLIEMNAESYISVSMSPIIDITYSQSASGDKCFDVLIQETRINLSVPFLTHLGRYFLDALLSDQVDEGIVNHGYESISHTTIDSVIAGTGCLNHSRYFQEQPDTSISVRILKPEILLFGDLKANNAYVILLEAEITMESSRRRCVSSDVCTFTDIRAKARRQRNYLRPDAHWLLRPCDIEISRKEELQERKKVEATLVVNAIDIHLSAEIMHTLIDILTEVTSFFNGITVKYEERSTSYGFGTHSDLWTAKKVLHIPYKETEDGSLEDRNKEQDRIVTFYLKPVLICILIEMDATLERLPIIKFDAVTMATVTDWLNDFHLESTLKVDAFCYNSDHKTWEPLIELCTNDNVSYKPWELSIKMCHGEACLINSDWTNPCRYVRNNAIKKRYKYKHTADGESMDMIFIVPEEAPSAKINENDFYSGYEDSDTDDDANPKNLAKTFNYLFNEDSSDDEDTESDDDSSTNGDDGCSELTSDYFADSGLPSAQEPRRASQPAMYAIVHSKEKISFTITPNTITMINSILDAFAQARNGIPIVPATTGKLNLQNQIGHPSRIEFLRQEEIGQERITRVIASQDFHICDSPASAPSSPEIEARSNLPSPRWIGTDENGFTDIESSTRREAIFAHAFYDESPVHLYKNITDELLRIVFEDFSDILVYCPVKADRNLIPLQPVRHEVRYHLVIDVAIDHRLDRTITVRSPLQFRNETSYALSLYYKKQLLEKLDLKDIGEAINPFDENIRLAVIEPDCTYSVPLYIAYHFPIYLLPVYPEKYQISDDGIFWKEFRNMKNAVKDIYCSAKDKECRSTFGVKVFATEIPFRTRPSSQVPNYLINILPPIVFNNQLPFVIDIHVPCIDYEVKIEPGEKINVHSLKCNNDIQFLLKIQNYLATQWTGMVKLNSNMERKFVLMSPESESDWRKPFVLCVELWKAKSWDVIVQSQYWIINKSGLPLFIQECYLHTVYEVPEEELMVLSLRNSKKDTIRLRAHQSEWSLPFGLDGISSMSLIVCRDIERGRKYRILPQVQTSRLSPSFTKILTYLPYFLVDNKTKRALRFMEENDEADLWYSLWPGQRIPFWPVTESMKMRVKWNNSQLISQNFCTTQVGKTVLRMDHGSALCVEVEGGTGSPFLVTFRTYAHGDAPVRIDNLCNELFLKINQENLGQVTLLNPFQSLLYTWDDPTMPRELIWNVYNNKDTGYKAHFETDGCGEEVVSLVTIERHDVDVASSSTASTTRASVDAKSIGGDTEETKNLKTVIYWLSYMEGDQRVLLFTQHESIFLKAKTIIDPEFSRLEFFLSLAGISLSVNVRADTDAEAKELVHASITDSAAHWEVCFGKRWKSLSLELSAWLECKYAGSSERAEIDGVIDVNLAKMHMTKPFFGKLRRTYSPGIWLHHRRSKTYTYLQGYLHRIQVDNQLCDATFPVVLHSSLQDRSLDHSGNRKLKHCVELVCLQQRRPGRRIYKGISVIVRELDLNLQEEFLLSLIELIPKRAETKHSVAAKLRKDVSHIHVAAFYKSCNDNFRDKKYMIEHVYVSPILIRLKLLAKTERTNTYDFHALDDYRNVVRFIFQYAQNGAFEKQAEFKLPCYRRKDVIKAQSLELFYEPLEGYMLQISQQFHVLIRSVVVLGNQYCYNFKLPGDRFYDPNLLLLSGDEISEKLCHEAECHLGHATADPVQISIFNFDNCEPHVPHAKVKDFFFTNMDVPPSSTHLTDNAFVTEMELEMSALIDAPTSGAQQDEVRYFFRTLGKKLSTLFKIESTSSSFYSEIIPGAIKRAQETGQRFICRMRLPRYINPYAGVEAFSTHKAKGMHLLRLSNKSHNADTYWAHTSLSDDGKCIVLVSLGRVYFVEKGSTWDSWDVKWTVAIDQLLSPPTVVNGKLVLHVNKNEDPTTPVVDWYLESKDTDILEWLCRKINIAMVLNMESSICSKHDV